MRNEQLKLKVQKILIELSKIDLEKIPKEENGSIKFPEFYGVKEVKITTDKLREFGINNDWLYKNGFVAAGLLLKI